MVPETKFGGKNSSETLVQSGSFENIDVACFFKNAVEKEKGVCIPCAINIAQIRKNLFCGIENYPKHTHTKIQASTISA